MASGDVILASGSAPRAPGGWWTYAVAWLLCLTIYLAAFGSYDVTLAMALRGAIVYVLPGVALGVSVLKLPRRLPWPEGSRARVFAVHLGVLAAFLLVSMAAWASLVGLDALIFEGAYRIKIDHRVIPWRILNDMLIYCTLTGVTYAWHNAAVSREQSARASRAEALRARAEMEAMRSQLNPHFILNTIHALVGLVRREPAIAEEALERLGDLLRYGLRVQREALDEVTLRDEWSFVQAYVDLERLRLGERLQIRFDAAPAVMDLLVPAFSVQILVENAIRHAIAPRAEGGRLSVTAREGDGRVRIEVQDDGPGTEPESPAESHGVGLRLLRERLAALYDGQASLDLHAAQGGVRAVLDLPERRLPEPS